MEPVNEPKDNGALAEELELLATTMAAAKARTEVEEAAEWLRRRRLNAARKFHREYFSRLAAR
jgi:hypothetical protein